MQIRDILILVLVFCFLSKAQTQETVDKSVYQTAEQQMWWNSYSKVENLEIRPRWQKNGTFWYTIKQEGERMYVHFDPKTKKKTVVSEKKEITKLIDTPDNHEFKENGIISPDGQKSVYIKDWNLWLEHVKSEKSKQLTFDGIENFGYATDNAGWRKSSGPVLIWSPDSKLISTFQQDQRHVSDMYMIKTKIGAPELKQWKYPLPEDKDVIKIHRLIINVENAEMTRLKVDADPRRGTLCDDISCDSDFDDNQWSEDGKFLAFVSSSRDHKIAQLRLANIRTGNVVEIHKEEVETQYESGQGSINWKYLFDSKEFIWYSEKDNWGHLYLYNSETGKLKNQITKGDFVVTSVVNIDEKNRKILFKAQGRENGRDPYFSHFYSVDFDGKNLKLLTPENAHHGIYISDDGKFFVDNYSTPVKSGVTVLRDSDGKLIETLNTANIEKLVEAGWKAPLEIITKSANEKYDLYGLMFTPANLDESRKYPVVNYIYPGPQGGGVGRRSFAPARSDHQALAELGFIVVVIDGSCNPGRSKEFHDECYGDMSTNTLEDQIAGLKQLSEKYAYLDLNKVGVWGHSGGGFATASAMFKYPEFYKVGISESGNHDNRNYEDDWGERYNGLMVTDEEGISNYEIQANQIHADKLQGKLLIAHGGMDDNVPVSNSYLLVDALIKANKDFDLLIFPNARHGYGKDSYYMTRKRWDYFVTHLQGKTPPKEFKFSPPKRS